MTEATPGAGALPGAVAALWNQLRDGLLRRVTALDDAAVALLGGALEPEQRRVAEREAHAVAGTVSSFGLVDISRVARSIELLLEGTEPLTEADALRLCDWVVELRAELEGAASVVDVSADDAISLLVVTAERDFADRVAMEAAGRDLVVESARDLDGARLAVGRRHPSAVVLDLDAAAEPADALSLLDELVAHPSAPAVVVMGVRDGFRDRVEAVRRGAREFLRKPLPPDRVLDAVERALQRVVPAGAGVLVASDDADLLAVMEQMLGARGMRAHAVEDPATFWARLRRVHPDIVVLDLDMPGLDGLDLCRALRDDPRWSPLPVLFLTTRSDVAAIPQIFAAGADEYVTKPVVGPDLVARLENCLERARLRTAAAEALGPAGLPAWQRTSEAITRLLHLARRVGVELAIARIDVDGFERLNSRLGIAAADEVLNRLALLMQAHAVPGDVVGWWGGDEFAVAFFGTGGIDAAQWLEEVLADAARDSIPTGDGEIHVTFSAGLACFPGDGADMVELTAASEVALAVAKRQGGARVVLFGSHGDSAALDIVDVAVVEDDPVLSELLLHALGMRRYVTRHLASGEEAVAALGGVSPPLHAHLILLAVGLPGRDGLSVLRELARDGVLARTRVMMLTSRSTEREVLMALDLGASEHVSKPFSVPVLLQRVSALLHQR